MTDNDNLTKQKPVSELRNWLSRFGESNRDHFEQGVTRKARLPCIHQRIQKFEVSLCSSSSISSAATMSENSPSKTNYTSDQQVVEESPSSPPNAALMELAPSPARSIAHDSVEAKSTTVSPHDSPGDFRIVSIANFDEFSPRRPGDSDNDSSHSWGGEEPHDFFSEWPDSVSPDLTPPRANRKETLQQQQQPFDEEISDDTDRVVMAGNSQTEDVSQVGDDGSTIADKDTPDNNNDDTDDNDEDDSASSPSMGVSQKASLFGSTKKVSAVQLRREALERKWAEDRAPTHSKKIQWHASGGTYKKKVILKVHT